MKKFLIIGNKNAITYKEIFPFVKNKAIKFGYTIPVIDIKVKGLCRWITTLPVENKSPIILTKEYSPELYPKYDNYNAINVDKVKDIPKGYEGVMGVPIGFLDKNYEGYEILWQASGNSYANAPSDILEYLQFNPEIKYGGGLGSCVLNGKGKYTRILIRKRNA